MAEERLYVKIERAGSAAGAGDKGSKPAEQPKSFFDKMGGAVKGGLKTAGVSFSMAAILKQSQLFTSYLGSVFQIIGGLIDVTLAPLMPIFIPVLKFLAKMMPGAAAVGKFVAARIQMVLDWAKNLSIVSGISEWWDANTPEWMHMSQDKLAAICGGIFATILLGKFFGIFKLAKWLGKITGINTIVSKIWTGFKGFIRKILAAPIGWIKRGAMWVLEKAGVPKLWVQLKSFAASMAKKLLSIIGSITGFFKDIAKKLIGGIASRIKNFGMSIWSKITNFFTKKFNPLSKALTWLKAPINFVKNIFKNILTAIKGGPMGILKGIANIIKNVLAKPFELLGKALSKIPGLGGLVKGLGNMFKGGAGKLIGKIGGKAGLKAAGMSIPGLGAAVGLGFGAYETMRLTKEHGMKGLAAGLTYTAAATAGGAMGGPVGLAVAIGSEVALNQFENRVLKVEVGGPDENAKVSMKTQNGKEQMMEVTNAASDFQPGFNPN